MLVFAQGDDKGAITEQETRLPDHLQKCFKIIRQVLLFINDSLQQTSQFMRFSTFLS